MSDPASSGSGSDAGRQSLGTRLKSKLSSLKSTSKPTSVPSPDAMTSTTASRAGESSGGKGSSFFSGINQSLKKSYKDFTSPGTKKDQQQAVHTMNEALGVNLKVTADRGEQSRNDNYDR